jgi:serine/threonine-protein kinase
MLPERWKTLQSYLDEALDGDAASQTALIERLRVQDPDLAMKLQELLLSHAALQDEGFLQQSASGLFNTPLAGQRLGAWTLLEPLGEGGMGSVWLARRDDGRFEGHAAVKLLNLTLAGAMRLERFRREGHILARLTHPNISHLLDAGVSPAGQPYLVLERVQGRQIDQYCDALQLDITARIRLFLTLLAAVSHAHLHLVVHRDIKPSNVMVTDDGQVKLLDFGIAKMLTNDDTDVGGVAGRNELTQQAGAMLSPGYAAPEQVNNGTITTATDVYALGVLLFVLLSGQHPTLRADSNMAQALRRTLEADAMRLSASVAGDEAAAASRACRPNQLRRLLSGDLDNIVAKALQTEPERRYASATAFAEDLQRYLAQRPVLAQRPSLIYWATKLLRRQRVPAAVAMVALLALVFVGQQAWHQHQSAQQNLTRAETVDGLLQSLFQAMSPDAAASRTFTSRELLDRAVAFLDSAAGVDPGTRHVARLRMAGLYRDIGAFKESLALFKAEALEAEKVHELPAQAMALWQVANVSLGMNDYDATTQALQSLQAVIDAGHVVSNDLPARLRMLQAELASKTNHIDLAVEASAQACALLESSGSTDLGLISRCVQGSAMAARVAGDIAGARAFFEQAIAIMNRRGESARIDRLSVTLDLGTLENWSGRYKEAVAILRPAQAEMLARLGPQHELYLSAVSELALAELRQGNFPQTRVWLAPMRGGTGPDDAWREDYADLLEARIKMYSGESAAAEPELRRLLLAMERSEGRITVATEPLRRMHGEAQLRLGRLAQAESELRDAEAHQISLANPRHNSVATTRVLLACALARRGEFEVARRMWLEASEVLNRDLGPQHPFTLAASSYAALAAVPAADQRLRTALAERLERELAWQDGAQALAKLLRAPPGQVNWYRLPTVL